MAQGWVSIHRNLFDSWLWEDKPFGKGQAWVDLILMANHEDKKTMLDGNLVKVKRGERITSIRKLSERWGWSRTKVDKFLTTLEKDEKVAIKKDSKKTVLTIVNYSVYQGSEIDKKATEKPVKSHRKATEKPQKSHRKTQTIMRIM